MTNKRNPNGYGPKYVRDHLRRKVPDVFTIRMLKPLGVTRSFCFIRIAKEIGAIRCIKDGIPKIYQQISI